MTYLKTRLCQRGHLGAMELHSDKTAKRRHLSTGSSPNSYLKNRLPPTDDLLQSIRRLSRGRELRWCLISLDLEQATTTRIQSNI